MFNWCIGRRFVWRRWKRLWVIGLVFVLVACGEVQENEIRTVLANEQSKLTAYHATAKMHVYSGQQPVVYRLQMSYQKPHFYRIVLEQPEKGLQQIVIRNEQGVFLVTPHLNKTFRFQSNWPSANGQVYLYQSLLDAIIKDPQGKAIKSEDGQSWIFEVQANVTQRLFSRQLIRLDAKNYSPQSVEVSDEHGKKWIAVQFDHFEKDAKLAADQFSVPNRSAMPSPVPDQRTANAQNEQPQSLTQVEPIYLPPGVEKLDERSITVDGRAGMVQRYGGAYEFSLWTIQPSSHVATVWGSDLLNVNGQFGIEKSDQTIAWWKDGLEYRLHSFNLPQSELLRIADSISVVNVKP